jgi:tricorn protease
MKRGASNLTSFTIQTITDSTSPPPSGDSSRSSAAASRDDLTFLFEEILSYLSVGQMFVRGGTQSPIPLPTVRVGLLGTDFTIENGRYRFTKIFTGENWNPDLQAPLTQPGADVQTGDYLSAVNGRQVRAENDVYCYFENTAMHQTMISVGSKSDGSDARDVTVVPVASEFRLRNLDWIEHNRREVDRRSGAKLAYVYVPDTGFGGFSNFNRYVFAQVGKQSVILERFNHGGQISDYIIDYLKRKPMAIIAPRDGRVILDPPLAIYGTKVMIINHVTCGIPYDEDARSVAHVRRLPKSRRSSPTPAFGN